MSEGQIKLLTAPIRSIVSFSLFQLAVVVAVILFLQAGDDKSARGQMFDGLDKVVESIGLGDIQREIFHQIMAHNRFLDCICLSRLFADSISPAVGNY